MSMAGLDSKLQADPSLPLTPDPSQPARWLGHILPTAMIEEQENKSNATSTSQASACAVSADMLLSSVSSGVNLKSKGQTAPCPWRDEWQVHKAKSTQRRGSKNSVLTPEYTEKRQQKLGPNP